MTNTEYQTLYTELQNCSHLDTTNKKTDYWKFADLAKLHPVQFNTQNPIENISQSIISHIPFTTVWSPDKLNQTASQHIRITDNGEIKLTRFGAWSVTKKYPELFATQLFFVHPNAVFDSWLSAAYRFGRLYWREQAGMAEKLFKEAMIGQSMSESNARRIMNAALFNDLPPNTIKEMKQIPIKETPDSLLNYMMIDLMRERTKALKTVLVWLAAPVQSQFLERGLYDVFSDARYRIIKKTGRAPEDNITRLHIAQVKHEYNKMEHNFRRRQISKHFR